MSRRVTLIVNPASGPRAEGRLEELRKIIAETAPGITIAEAKHGKLLECARSAANNCDVLAVAGGDGSVSAVAGIALEHGKIFGVIPFGTLNHFAHDIHLPAELADAVKVLQSGEVTKIDYATVGGRVFLNNSSIGLYPTLVERREKQERKIGKWPAAAKEAWEIIRRPIEAQKLVITAGEDVRKLRTAFVFIGNNDYHLQDAGISNRPSLTHGHLSLFALRHGGRATLLAALWRTLIGQKGAPDVVAVKAPKITIAGHKDKLNLAADGEVFSLPSPVEFECHPLGLSVLTPPQER